MPTSPMLDETPADRLRSAASYIRNHFTRGALADAAGNVCAIGALTQVRSGDAAALLSAIDITAVSSADVLHRYLRSLPDDGLLRRTLRGGALAALTVWNDFYVRDGAEVADAMEKAAAAWEESHGQ